MSSNTDVLSNEPISSADEGHVTIMRKRGNFSQDSFLDISDDIRDEIDELLDAVPELNDHFLVKDKIGSGTFSSVFVAELSNHPEIEEQFAIKHILPTSHPSRIEHELRCLYEIGGTDNVMGVQACFRHKDHVVIVMPYFPHVKFQDYVREVSFTEVKEYMWNLLLALRRVHQLNIIHRDIKPSNFLVNQKLKRFALVDFGLAQLASTSSKQVSSISDRISPKPTSTKCTDNSPTSVTLKAVSVQLCDIKASNCNSPSKNQTNNEKTNSGEHSKKRKADQLDKNSTPSAKRLSEEKAVPRRIVPEDRRLAEININTPRQTHQQSTKPSTSCRLASGSVTNQPHFMKEARVVIEKTPTIPSKDKLNFRKQKAIDSDIFNKDTKLKSPRRTLLTRRMNVPPTRGQLMTSKAAQNVRPVGVPVLLGSAQHTVIKAMSPSACKCYSNGSICSICLARSHQVASRAGTPGFRSPEVLMKCPNQTTAVDVWSAGVIFLTLLTGRYPFFKASDDMTALGQMVRVFGSEEMKKAAREFGKELTVGPVIAAVNMREVCEKLRGINNAMKSTKQDNDWISMPDSTFDLLSSLLDLNPLTRITADSALKHPFFTQK